MHEGEEWRHLVPDPVALSNRQKWTVSSNSNELVNKSMNESERFSSRLYLIQGMAVVIGQTNSSSVS